MLLHDKDALTKELQKSSNIESSEANGVGRKTKNDKVLLQFL